MVMELSQAIRKFLNHQKSMGMDRAFPYWVDLAQFDAFINGCNCCYTSKITDATPDQVQKFLEYIWIQENGNVKKITKVMKSLNDFDQYCLEHRWLTGSMMNGVTLPNGPISTEVKPFHLTFIPPLLFSAIMAKLLRGPVALKQRVMLLMLAMTGMRIAELKSITWEDIDFEKKSITVKGVKSGMTRVLPLFCDLSDHLQQYKQETKNTASEEALIFPNEHLVKLTRIFRKFLNDHGFIKGLISLRTLRSTYANLLYLSQKDRSQMMYISALMGKDVSPHLNLIKDMLGFKSNQQDI